MNPYMANSRNNSRVWVQADGTHEVMKLLIAEDDLTSRTVLTAVSRKWGYEPVAVEDGEAAWEVMQTPQAPRLLLLDWMMPRLDGLALCQRIREHKSDDPPFIILLTSRSETGDIVAGLKAGANDYIAKPFDNAELQARLQVGRRMLDLQAELSQAREELSFQATHDALTGMFNRRAIMSSLDKEMARAKRQAQCLCICMCDIDHFKRVNDAHGHLAGDAVLYEIAKRISTTLRPYDLVGRYGGEEFLILLNIAKDQALNLFERIRHNLMDTPIVFEQNSLEVTASFGVAIFAPPEDRRESTALISAADTALYAAKTSGRNQIIIETP